MNTIDAVVPALGWALLHFLWQGALVGAVAALLLAQLHDARAQARYAVCLVALAACVVLPLATLLAGLPGSPAFPLPAVDAMPVAGAARPVETAAFIDAVTWRARLQPWLPAIVFNSSRRSGVSSEGRMWLSAISTAVNPRRSI